MCTCVYVCINVPNFVPMHILTCTYVFVCVCVCVPMVHSYVRMSIRTLADIRMWD